MDRLAFSSVSLVTMRIDQIGSTFASCRLNSLPDLKYLGLIAIKSRTAVAIRDPTGSSHVHWKNIGIFFSWAWAKTFAVIIAKIAKHIASLFISFSWLLLANHNWCGDGWPHLNRVPHLRAAHREIRSPRACSWGGFVGIRAKLNPRRSGIHVQMSVCPSTPPSCFHSTTYFLADWPSGRNSWARPTVMLSPAK